MYDTIDLVKSQETTGKAMTKMNMSITTTIRIYPTPEQEKLLSQTSCAYVDACNVVSQWIFDNKNISQGKVHDNTYKTIRSTTGLASQMAASSIRTVITTYKTIHSKKKKFSIQPMFKKNRYVAVYNRDYAITKGGQLSLGTINGRIKG